MLQNIMRLFIKQKSQNNIIRETLNSNYNNNNTAIMQGIYIRDIIGIENIIKKVFIENKIISQNIIYETWNLEPHVKNYNELACNDNNIKNIIYDYFYKKISNISKNQISIILVSIPGHINLIYIDTRSRYKWKYYYYEPHYPNKKYDEKYTYIEIADEIFKKNGFSEINLSKNVLQQEKLPLCYIYVLHSFVNLCNNNDNYNREQNNAINIEIDDVLIIEFTRKLLKLCYNSNLINDLDYYLLTNDITKINANIKNNINNIKKNLFMLSCEPNIISQFIEKYDITINFLHINKLHDEQIELDYFGKIYEQIQNKNISRHNIYQLYLLLLVLKHNFKLNICTDLFQNIKINKNILEKNIIESNILYYYQNYNLFKIIIKYIDNGDDKREIIKYIYDDIIIKKKDCDENYIRYIKFLRNQKRLRKSEA
jgi:hypothetical protein